MNLRVPKYVKAEWQVGCSQSKAAAAAPALPPTRILVMVAHPQLMPAIYIVSK